MSNTSESIRLLESVSDASIRNTLALELAESKDPEVLKVLIELINRPDLRDSRGTLVYCLKFYDPEPHFNLLIELATDGNWEVAHEGFEILNSIEKMSGPQATTAYRCIKSCSENEKTEEWRKALLKRLIESFDR